MGLVVWIGIDSLFFGQIFGLIPKLQNSLTFVCKLTNGFGSLVVPAPVVIMGRRKLVLLPVW